MNILKFMPAAVLAFCSMHASASLISIGLQQSGVNGGAITTVTSDGGSGLALYASDYGTFLFNFVLADGYPDLAAQGALASGSVQTSASAAGTLSVYITETGLTAPTGSTSFASNFSTSDFEGSAISVVESTFFSPTNQLYAGMLLGSQAFTSAGSVDQAIVESLTGTYSETMKYVITVGSGVSAVSSAITLTPVAVTPEPSSLVLLATGIFGIAGMARRRFMTL